MQYIKLPCSNKECYDSTMRKTTSTTRIVYTAAGKRQGWCLEYSCRR